MPSLPPYMTCLQYCYGEVLSGINQQRRNVGRTTGRRVKVECHMISSCRQSSDANEELEQGQSGGVRLSRCQPEGGQ